ncbi:MAG: FtsX-like permease family protein [Lachnospiraceae bacterium]
MKIGFYSRLAWNNIKKNARLYIPDILTGMGLTAVFYIILTLSMDNRLNEVRGGRYLSSIMPLGVVIVALLSFILVLYTNSFLMKQRNREFGLYNVLGMEKRHIGNILFWETAICSFFVLIGGLAAGIILYKLCALLICRILTVDSVLGFYHISPKTLIPTALFFLSLYLLTYLFNRIHIAHMKPVELLQSIHTGEKEPKVKWLLLLIGIASLSTGYYISVTTAEPLKAIELFFAAVILVIIGTYCLFITGSTALLKLLKRNQRFYYHKKHMIAVSGLLYRMKQNAVGLASITILATMVLVMVSTTVSMYAGIGDTINRQYPHQITMSSSYEANGENVAIPAEDLLTLVRSAAEENHLNLSFSEQQRYLCCAFRREGDTFWTDRSVMDGNLMECWFITADEYQKLTGEQLSLSENEMAVYGLPDNSEQMTDSFTIGNNSFDCTTRLTSYPISMTEFNIVDCFGFVVSDETAFQRIYELQKEAYQKYASEISCKLVIDFNDEEAVAAVYDKFSHSLHEQMLQYVNSQPDSDGGFGMSVDSKWDTIEYLYGMYGTLLFLGLLLSLVFLFATALIIYYKQISEGYEDRNRFQIMQKVGMSADEVKGAVRSQILLVFFLPLITAAMHIAFAFPILTRLLRVLFQSNQALFMGCTIASLGIFAAIYVLIYSITAKLYYQIVR